MGVWIRGSVDDRALQGVKWVQRAVAMPSQGGGFAGLGTHPSRFALP